MHTYCINAINQSSFNQSEDSSQSINQFNPKGSKHPINQVRAPWIDWLIDSKSVDYSEYLNRLAWLQRIESSRVEFVLIRVESNFFWSDSIRPNRTTPGFDSIRFDRSSSWAMEVKAREMYRITPNFWTLNYRRSAAARGRKTTHTANLT